MKGNSNAISRFDLIQARAPQSGHTKLENGPGSSPSFQDENQTTIPAEAANKGFSSMGLTRRIPDNSEHPLLSAISDVSEAAERCFAAFYALSNKLEPVRDMSIVGEDECAEVGLVKRDQASYNLYLLRMRLESLEGNMQTLLSELRT